MKKVFEKDFRGRKIVVEHGEVAKQAHGSVLVRYGDTVILSTVVVSKTANILSDFFPLMVLYQEKLYSVGKIPGGFIKREGRPTDAATLAARMIDRPMRPMFPEDFRNEVQVVNTVLSVDTDNSPELTAMFGSSLATCISKIPFDGPIAGVKVGRVNGEFVINPTPEELEVSDLDLTVAGTKQAINMVEAGAKEVSEEDMLDALMFGHEAVKELCEFQEEIIKEIGEEKMEYEHIELEEELVKEITELAADKLDKAMRIKEKLEKYAAIDAVKEEIITKYEEENKDKLDQEELTLLLTKVKLILENIEYDIFRSITVNEKTRSDGRSMTEIRPLSTAIDLLPRTHGSALFTRGETQALAVTTLGALNENQILDGLSLETEKRFMLHYNFPAFSVGETGRYGSPGRREIGHGYLAERALIPVLPSEEEFPYAIRSVTEIMSQNGSTSMAATCSSCMALMDAGVPLKRPVSGVAMGLMVDVPKGTEITASDVDKAYVLTDLMDAEDFAGDMDFKVTGTTEGVTALQMDMKVHGLPVEIMEKALKQSHEGRMFILKHILEVIDKPRAEISKYAPQIEKLMINPDKIGAVIGKGGEMINKITTETGAEVDIEDSGLVTISGNDPEKIAKALEWIKSLTEEPEVGKIYNGIVVTIKDFGAFVNIMPGIDGMLHISQIVEGRRLKKVEEVLHVGDKVRVRLVAIDNGKLSLSMIGIDK